MKRWLSVILFVRYSASWAGGDISAEPVRLSRLPLKFLQGRHETATWLLDPFYPTPSRFEVTAVISRKMAFVNNQWVRLGERFGIYHVTEILSDAVILENGFTKIAIKVKQ